MVARLHRIERPLCRLRVLLPHLDARFPVPNLALGLIPGDAVTLLDLADELIAVARHLVELVVSELAPLLLQLATHLLPVALNAIPVHAVLRLERKEQQKSGAKLMPLVAPPLQAALRARLPAPRASRPDARRRASPALRRCSQRRAHRRRRPGAALRAPRALRRPRPPRARAHPRGARLERAARSGGVYAHRRRRRRSR